MNQNRDGTVKTQEINNQAIENTSERIQRQMNEMISTLSDRVKNSIAGAVNEMFVPKVEMAVRLNQ